MTHLAYTNDMLKEVQEPIQPPTKEDMHFQKTNASRDALEAQAFSVNPQHVDIYTSSWGPEDNGATVGGPGPLARQALETGARTGRGGKGYVISTYLSVGG